MLFFPRCFFLRCFFLRCFLLKCVVACHTFLSLTSCHSSALSGGKAFSPGHSPSLHTVRHARGGIPRCARQDKGLRPAGQGFAGTAGRERAARSDTMKCPASAELPGSVLPFSVYGDGWPVSGSSAVSCVSGIYFLVFREQSISSMRNFSEL